VLRTNVPEAFGHAWIGIVPAITWTWRDARIGTHRRRCDKADRRTGRDGTARAPVIGWWTYPSATWAGDRVNRTNAGADTGTCDWMDRTSARTDDCPMMMRNRASAWTAGDCGASMTHRHWLRLK
jgi:hypothetical protein